MTASATRTELVLKIAESTSGAVGQAFLSALVGALSEAMNVTLAIITVGRGAPPTRARAVYALRDGAPADIEYDLDGTPCGLVYGGERMVIPCDLQQMFARERGFEGYVGVPLHDVAGAVSGHVAVFSRDPITDPDFALSLVRVFAQRVEAERRRDVAERARETLIADLREASERLSLRYRRLRAANAFKTRLIGLIAHDLRNPLAAIMSQAERIGALLGAATPRVDRAGEAAERVIRNAERLSERIDAALAQVREDSAALSLTLREVDAAQIAAAAIEANRDAAERKRIAFRLEAPAPCPCRADEDLLLDALDNLLSNAVKYSQADTTVTTTVAAEDGGVRIAVRDQGQGLSEADLARAFLPFQTLSARPTGGESSVGLGLANVREVAAAHGGRVWAESDGLGMGARFVLELPA